MSARLLPSRLPRTGQSPGRESRRGSPCHIAKAILAAAILTAGAPSAQAEPWLGLLQPQSLLSEVAAAGFVGAGTAACIPGRACLAEEPVAAWAPATLFGSVRLQSGLLAEGMLSPAGNAILLILRMEGRSLSFEELTRPPNAMRILKSARNRALFRRLGDPVYLQVLGLLATGMTLLLASTVLGLAVRGPGDPILPPKPDSGEHQALPSLIVTPYNPLQRRL